MLGAVSVISAQESAFKDLLPNNRSSPQSTRITADRDAPVFNRPILINRRYGYNNDVVVWRFKVPRRGEKGASGLYGVIFPLAS